jgi:hypothetical protein
LGLLCLPSAYGAVSNRPAAAASACADLTAILTLRVNPPPLNQLFTIQIDIVNQGDAPTGRFRTYLYVDPAEQPPTTATKDTISFGYPNLAIHERFTYEYDQTFTTAGIHKIYVWTDRDNQVAPECSENNNLVWLTVPLGVTLGCTLDPYEAGSSENFCSTAPTVATDGVVQHHNLCTPDDEDWVRFTGRPGVEYDIVVGNVESATDLQVELRTQCDAPPIRQKAPLLGRGVALQQSITQAGSYYLRVKPATTGPNTGYDLSITPRCSIDAYEPNNDCSLAQTLQLDGAVQPRSFCGAYDTDWLLLPATAGVTYQINTAQPEGKSQPRLALFDACDGRPPLQQSEPLGALTWTALQTGLYPLRMMNGDPTVEGVATGYTLQVTTPSRVGESTEPNETPLQAKALLIDQPAEQYAFFFPGDQDWYTIDATENQSLRLETTDLAPATDTYLCLYGPDGATPLGCDDDSGAGLGSKLVWQAPTTGRYYLRLRHVAPDAGGNDATYRLAVKQSAVSCEADPYEPDNAYGQAREITLDPAGQRHTICRADDSDWVRFWVQTPGVYAIHAEAEGADADPVVALYDVDGQHLLFENDDYTSGLSARILWSFTRTGVYYIRVHAFSPTADGHGTEYRLRVQPSQEQPTALPTTPPPPTPTPTATPTPTPTATPTAQPEAPPTPSGPVKTLIITNPMRLRQYYGEAAAQTLATKLVELAQSAAVSGLVVTVDDFFAVTQAYALWDLESGSIAKANAVTDVIHNVIWYQINRYPQVEYLVLIGDDRILPHRRLIPGLKDKDERPYAESNLAATTTVGQALRQEALLFDDFYAARQPQLVQGAAAYLPEKAVGRLVETTQEISQTIAYFLQRGEVQRSSALIVGNDLNKQRLATARKLCDQTKGFLGAATNCKIAKDAWGAATLMQWHFQANPSIALHWLGIHGRHWALQLADQHWLDAATVTPMTPALTNAIVVALGSHTGLAVAPDEVHPLDWPQFYSQQGAILIGNSATELYSKEEALVLSRKFFAQLARQLFTRPTVGAALVAAKRQYWQEARDPNLYDRFVLQQAMLFSLPMYRLPSALSGPNEFPSVNFTSLSAASNYAEQPGAVATGDLTLGLADSYTSLVLTTTAEGDYYALDGHVNWKPNAAGQPLYFVDLDTTKLGLLGAARGVLWVGGVYTDVLMSNMLIPRVTTGAETLAAHANANPVDETADEVIGANPIPAQLDASGQRLIVEWGHYAATANQQRLYGNIALELTFSSAIDTLAPTIQYSAAQATVAGITVKVEAGDASGIQRVVVAYTDGNGNLQSLNLTYHPDMQKWVGLIPGLRRAAWFAQVVDGAGNVAYGFDKGKFFYASSRALPVYTLYLPTVVR